jgi:Acyclic terpene utilisation family protein AtuA
MNSLLIGCAAGGSGDRLDAAAPVVATLIDSGKPSVLIFENLAERTLALAQLARRADPAKGYEPLLEWELRPILADCLTHGIPIVSNFGAANPRAAAEQVLRLAKELGIAPPKIALIEGDDLSDDAGQAMLRPLLPDHLATRPIVSANVYQGAFEIAHFQWGTDEWDLLAGGTVAGHLLECGAQVTGGYFADPGVKDVPGLAAIGYPIVEILPDGSCIVGKAAETRGLVDARTVKEQLLYEIGDPRAYLTPDVCVDLGGVTVTELGGNRVRVEGVRGHHRPTTLKALVFYEGGWLGEAEISYAGPNAEALARHAPGHAQDVRLRVAARHDDEHEIERLLREVYSLWLCGPAGGGGVRTSKRQRLDSVSCLVPRSLVTVRRTQADRGTPLQVTHAAWVQLRAGKRAGRWRQRIAES